MPSAAKSFMSQFRALAVWCHDDSSGTKRILEGEVVTVGFESWAGGANAGGVRVLGRSLAWWQADVLAVVDAATRDGPGPQNEAEVGS